MNVLDLFSGIGGFSLGLERAGMRTVAFCEIDPYCRAVLRKHWPDVPCFEDVRTLTGADVPGVDLICGGFPCQDISSAGTRQGLAGERSGLWGEFSRLIGEFRPRYAIVENVSRLAFDGLLTVLGDLAALGFDAEWHCIQAADIGAPHIRDRVWIIAQPASERQHEGTLITVGLLKCIRESQTAWQENRQLHASAFGASWIPPYAGNERMDDGLAARMDRFNAIGNSVVPAIPEAIGRAILQAEGMTTGRPG